MNEKLITIAEFASCFEAQVAKADLETAGIKAVIVGESIKDLLPADGMLNVQLQVFAASAEEAIKILDCSNKQTPDQSEDCS